MIADAAAHAYAQGHGLGQIKGRRDMLTEVMTLLELEKHPEAVKLLRKSFARSILRDG